MYHKLKNCLISRSSHKSCSIEKAVLKYFAIFTGKHLCWSLLLIDCGTDLQFSCEYCKTFMNTYFDENLGTTVSVVPASCC